MEFVCGRSGLMEEDGAVALRMGGINGLICMGWVCKKRELMRVELVCK